jgi:hypothetical protein
MATAAAVPIALRLRRRPAWPRARVNRRQAAAESADSARSPSSTSRRIDDLAALTTVRCLDDRTLQIGGRRLRVTQPGPPAPQPQERLLGELLGQIRVAHQAERETRQPRIQREEKFFDRLVTVASVDHRANDVVGHALRMLGATERLPREISGTAYWPQGDDPSAPMTGRVRRAGKEASGHLVVPPVFKTGGRRAASSAGSIPVRLRHLANAACSVESLAAAPRAQRIGRKTDARGHDRFALAAPD